MNALATAVNLVEKENISHLSFPSSDVLLTEESRIERESRIKRAMTLGNTRKSKVRIVFEDAEGIKTVETTIWGITEKSVILKQTTTIPIHRVHQIKFY